MKFGKKRRKRDTFDDEFEDLDLSFQKLSHSFEKNPNMTVWSKNEENLKNNIKHKSQNNSNPNLQIPNKNVTTDEINIFQDFESDVASDNLGSEESMIDLGEYFSIEYYPEPYCDIVNKMPTVCLELSILELWANDGKYDEATDLAMELLTKESILYKMNNYNKSGIYLMERNFTSLLGGVKLDSSGKIIGAESTVIRWFIKMNATEALLVSISSALLSYIWKTRSFSINRKDKMV